MWESATVLSLLPGLIQSVEKRQPWRQGCCDLEDDCFVGAGTQIRSGSVNPRECAGIWGRMRNGNPEPPVKTKREREREFPPVRAC